MITEKMCNVCKKTKAIEQFYKNKGTNDGHTSDCKVCNLARTKRYQATEQGKQTIRNYLSSEFGKVVKRRASAKFNKTEKRRISNRRFDTNRSGTPSRKASHNKAAARYRKNHPQEISARTALNLEVRNGNLPHVTTLKCVDCGRSAQQYDHWQGYDKHNWLNVQAVCIKCHAKRHLS